MKQRYEAPGHMGSAVKKQKDEFWCSSHLFLFHSNSLVYGMVLPTVRVRF